MKKPVFVIRDLKVGFMQPILEINEETAKRNFQYSMKNSTGIMAFEPGDFDLYYLGTFDDINGKFEQVDMPILVMNGSGVNYDS